MAFSLSPSVDVREFELSLTVPNLPSAKTGMVLYANSGPCNKIVTITSENDLVSTFGKPDKDNYFEWFNAWNFLQYASSLYVVRALPKYMDMSGDIDPLIGTYPLEYVKNAGAAITGDSFAHITVDPSYGYLYNQDVAEQFFEVERQTGDFGAGAPLYLFNKNITNEQKHGIAICSNKENWNKPICKDLYAAAAIVNGAVSSTSYLDKNQNTSFASILVNANNNKLIVGSKLIDNYKTEYLVTGFQPFTDTSYTQVVTNSTSNSIPTGAFDTYYGVINTVETTGAGTENRLIFYNNNSAAIGNNLKVGMVITKAQYPDLFSSGTEARLEKFDEPASRQSSRWVLAGTLTGEVVFNLNNATGTIVSNVVEKIAVVTGNNNTYDYYIDVELGHTYEAGDDFKFDDEETWVVEYVEDTKIWFAFPLGTTTKYPSGTIATRQGTNATIQSINGFDSKYDQSLIKTTEITLAPKTGTSRKVKIQSLKTFSEIQDYEPDFKNNEFFISVLKKNSLDKYQIAEKYVVSWDRNGKDVNGKSIWIDNVFFNTSKELYALTYPEYGASLGYKPNTANSNLITLGAGWTRPNHIIEPGSNDISWTPWDFIKASIQDAEQLFADSESFDVNILIANRYNLDGMSEIAESRKDCIAIVGPTGPDSYVSKLSSECTTLMIDNYGARSTNENKVFTRFGTYSAVYGNFKYQYDKFNDVNRWMSVAGDVAGLYAQTDANRDPWWAPAGLERGKMKNVIKLAFNPNKQNRDDLYVNSINPIMSIPGEGSGVVFGQKTATAKPSAMDRVNVRRLLITIEKAIATAVRYSLFEFNDSFTRNRLRGMIEPFLRSVKARRGLYDYLVIVDESNNTGQVIDSNALVIDIYLKPTKVAEFIQVNAYVTRTDANFAEIVGKGP